ncbi:hypothetical protein YTPLAS73_09640 [Nitrosarchaeum sp.]|nr:hypothetical protein YTPLAS73_09640 [Nitrosarchaeum sp.]
MHEREIITAIEKAGFEGINVRGLVRAGLSPSTLLKYLPILENEKKLVYHEKIKNSDIYKIRTGNEITYEESKLLLNRGLDEISDVLTKAVEYSQKWGIAEQLEVYQHAVNVITLMKYIKQFGEEMMDIDKDAIPNDINDYVKRLDELSKTLNKKINLFLSPLVMVQLENTMSESLEYLEAVAKKKKRKGRKSKHIQKIEPELAKTFSELLELNKLEK